MSLYISTFPVSAEQYLQQLERYAIHRRQHPGLELFTYMLPVEDRLVDAVLNSESKLNAARALLFRISNIWD